MDRENSRKYFPFGEKIIKIDPVDPEIIWLGAIIKKGKKLTQAKYIANSAKYSPVGKFADLPSGLNKHYLCSRLARF